jgi:hypothetical protein
MLSEPGYIPKGYLYRKAKMPPLYKKAMEYLELKVAITDSSTDNTLSPDKKDKGKSSGNKKDNSGDNILINETNEEL